MVYIAELLLNYVPSNDEQGKWLLSNIMTVLALFRLDRQQFSLLGGAAAQHGVGAGGVGKGSEWHLSHAMLPVFELSASALFSGWQRAGYAILIFYVAAETALSVSLKCSSCRIYEQLLDTTNSHV